MKSDMTVVFLIISTILPDILRAHCGDAPWLRTCRGGAAADYQVHLVSWY